MSEEINKLNSLGIKLEILKNKVNTTPRLPIADRKAVKSSIQEIADTLSDILGENTISVEVNAKLEKQSRKQIVFINKAIDQIQNTLEISKKYLG